MNKQTDLTPELLAISLVTNVAQFYRSRNTAESIQSDNDNPLPITFDVSRLDIDWDKTAASRHPMIFHFHCSVLPILEKVLLLRRGNLTKRKEMEVRRSIISRLMAGGSNFGPFKVLAQKIRLHGFQAILSEEMVNNHTIGKISVKKSPGYSGKPSVTHSYLGLMLQPHSEELIAFNDPVLNSFFLGLIAYPLTVYENSVINKLCWHRTDMEVPINEYVSNFKFNL